jgi:hypothetical protein
MEAWTKDLPKIGVEEAKTPKHRVGYYGNYRLTDLLMELITFLKEKANVVVVPGEHTKYFKQLELDILKLASEMVRLL